MGTRTPSCSRIPWEIVGSETLDREIVGYARGFHDRGLRTVLGSMCMERRCHGYSRRGL